ncbi:HAD family hydrolase [Salsipaludibacter albus]|uniref:HAD family hydrolase n=1 Tax=Salsipaludibacter albus TaxID=2849650 RepID=UPI001EE42DB8|nr:HAD family phosphatase [Salsipaludibacter albus]MBY5162995.1 HAD family phosphatase [Salsipaludibacter albus]
MPAAPPVAPELAGVIFDLDGTLVDTESVSDRVFRTALERLGHAMTDDDVHELRGHAWSFIGPWMQDRFGVTEQAYRAEAVPLWDDAFATGLATFPDTVDVLHALQDEGVPVAVCTSSGRHHLDRILATVPDLAGRFAVSVSATEVTNHKPHPEPYERARRLLGTPAARTVAIEDSATGVAAAVGASLRVVGRQSGTRTDLSAAHLQVETLTRPVLDEVLVA